MNRHVTTRAFATGLESKPPMRRLSQKVKACVTLQAQLPPFTTHEKHAIRRPVRAVTRRAPFYFCRWMLMNKRAMFVDVTLRTCLRCGFYET